LAAKQRAMGCRECGLLFVHPQPTAESLAGHYAPGGVYRARQKAKPPKQASPESRELIAAAHRRALSALDRFFPATQGVRGTVLDFGCGAGRWLDVLQDCGWSTWGIEPSTEEAFTRHQRLEGVPMDERFDFVFAHHVLEHMAHPLDTLRAFARALRPGGYCWIAVPRVDTLPVYADIGYCLQARTHIVAFTEACLTDLLARAGFGVVAALHELDAVLTSGRPISLRLVAQKGAPASRLADPFAPLARIAEWVASAPARPEPASSAERDGL
jgi:SAM-dependent methyltransferase